MDHVTAEPEAPASTLKDWLRSKRGQITIQEFAARIGVWPQAVHAYVNGRRIPRRAIMERIVKETSGAVSPASFYKQ